MLKGCDVSNWQGDFYPQDCPVDFCVTKATEGLSYVNPMCDAVVQRCIANGIKWGFYHYASGSDPVSEANYFYQNCKNYFGEGVPVLDFEGEAIGAWGVSGARMFLQRVYELSNVRPMVYMSQSVTYSFDWSSVASDFGLWCAVYPNQLVNPDLNVDIDFSYNIGAWEFAAMWQFCSDGRIAGYNGDLDLDFFFGDGNAWDLYAGKTDGVTIDQHKETHVFEDEKLKVTVEEK